MKLIRNYILKEFLKIFFVIMVSFLVLFLVVDFFDRFPRLMRRGATIDTMSLYFVMRIPYLFLLSSPITVLLSGLFLMDNLSKHNESLAMRSSGISVYRIVQPLIIFALLFSIFMVWFSDFVYPKAESYRRYIYKV
ncbi:MAG: LptF/LptG family permease, partial [Candidatus Cloacimonadota bacterium]|nr:LptF/LptG family permease [Candidatus Cloacimonadota bacterium]